MLSRSFRLKKETDFRRVYRKGKKMRGFFFDTTYLSNPKHTRFGIVVTTKSINKATKRNAAKRLLRRCIIKNYNSWPQKTDLIIKIKKEIKKEEVEEAEKELLSMIVKI